MILYLEHHIKELIISISIFFTISHNRRYIYVFDPRFQCLERPVAELESSKSKQSDENAMK